jgi:DNA-binding CsgD family transcriptional regulator
MERSSAIASVAVACPSRPPHPPTGVAAVLLQRELLRLHAALRVDEFVRAVFALLYRALPLHFQCLSLWPEGWKPTLPFRDAFPFKDLAEANRYADLYPLGSIVLNNPEPHIYRQSDLLSLAQVRRTSFYRAFMAPEGWLYHCVLAFWENGKPFGLLGLHRRSEQGDFHDCEIQLLEELHPHLTAAWRRVYRLDRERAQRASVESMLARLPLPVVVADWDLHVMFSNEAAARLCATEQLGTAARHLKLPATVVLPPSVQAACVALRAPAGGPGNGGHTPAAHAGRTVAVGGTSDAAWTAQVALERIDPVSLSRPVFLVHFSPMANGNQDPPRDVPSSALPLLVQLTRSERIVALLVRDGLRNREIARRLGKSTHTVAKQLQTVFKKLRASNRTRLAVLLR